MQRYRKVIFVPTKMIVSANENGWSRGLAYLIKLKSLFKNNCVYKFNLRKVAEMIGCSPACLSYHLKDLESRGLIRYHSGNIVFTGLKKQKELFHAKHTTAVAVSEKNQLDILRALIIKFNLQRQEYRMRKAGIKLRRGNVVPDDINERLGSSYVGLSCKRIAFLFGLKVSANSGTGSGHRIRKKIEDLGFIKSKRMYSVFLDKATEDDFWIIKRRFNLSNLYFYKDGQIRKSKRNKITFTSIPMDEVIENKGRRKLLLNIKQAA